MFYESIWCNPKPIIASVHGYVLARGGDLAGFCDITIAADDALFGYPVMWQTPTVPKSIWPWTIGLKLTKELVFTGRYMPAEEAREHGLVNRVVPRDELQAETDRLAVLIANGADKRPQKRGINTIFERFQGLEAALTNQWRPQPPAQGDFYGGDDPVNVAFRRRVRDEGMKAALDWRARRMRGEASLDD
jgi:enoyl-CoA hydratase